MLDGLCPDVQSMGRGIENRLRNRLNSRLGLRLRQALGKTYSECSDSDAAEVGFLVSGLQTLDGYTQVEGIGNTRRPEDFEKWEPMPRRPIDLAKMKPTGFKQLQSNDDSDGWPTVFDGVQRRLDTSQHDPRMADSGSSRTVDESNPYLEKQKKVYNNLVKNTSLLESGKMFLNADYILLHLLFLLEGKGDFPTDEEIAERFQVKEKLTHRNLISPLMYLTNLTALIMLPGTTICKNPLKAKTLWELNVRLGNQFPPQVDQIHFAILKELLETARGDNHSSRAFFERVLHTGREIIERDPIQKNWRKFFNCDPNEYLELPLAHGALIESNGSVAGAEGEREKEQVSQHQMEMDQDSNRTTPEPASNDPESQGQTEPVRGEEDPVRGEEDPVQGEEDPVQGEEDPVQGEEDPVQGEEEPVRGEKEPVRGEKEPVRGGKKLVIRFKRGRNVVPDPESEDEDDAGEPSAKRARTSQNVHYSESESEDDNAGQPIAKRTRFLKRNAAGQPTEKKSMGRRKRKSQDVVSVADRPETRVDDPLDRLGSQRLGLTIPFPEIPRLPASSRQFSSLVFAHRVLLALGFARDTVARYERERIQVQTQSRYPYERLCKLVSEGIQPNFISSISDMQSPSDIFQVSGEKWLEMTRKEKQDMFAAGNILISSSDGKGEPMTLDSLRDIADLRTKYTVHPASLLGSNVLHGSACLQELWDESQREDGHILNALALPPVTFSLGIEDLQSDEFATRQVYGPEMALETCRIFHWVTSWTICATKDAYHPLHVDTHGLATCVGMQKGMKLWIVWCPRDKEVSRDIADVLELFEEQSHLERADKDKGKNKQVDDGEMGQSRRWTPVLLIIKAGDRFLMQPNTPHCVVSLEDCIAYGLHFYSSSTITLTCIGLCCSFVRLDEITNNDHKEVRRMLVTMLGYWVHEFTCDDYFDRCKMGLSGHIPNILTMTGLNDLVIVINTLDLGSLIWRERYSEQGLADDDWKLERLGFKYAARALLFADTTMQMGLDGKAASVRTYRKGRLIFLVRELLSEISNVGEAEDHAFKEGLRKDFGNDKEFDKMMNNGIIGSMSKPTAELDGWTLVRAEVDEDRVRTIKEKIVKNEKLGSYLD
ncbi:hypothetical protein VKT23_009676 [Stygiomarasmius scandens]|uniref:JmjC domain-containing protein n=2 Tax=Marasmiellus scandens TaxID=2682957 RepID=A0ABR1JFT2_9AGAR